MARAFVHIGIWLAAPLAAAAAADQKILAPQESSQESSLPHDADLQKVKHELVKAEIIPTVIDEFLPSLILDVEFPSDHVASLGNTLKVKNVQEEPTFTLTRPSELLAAAAPNLTYTITLTDPDAPSRDNPEWAEMCHFIATGITLSADSDGSSSSSSSSVFTPSDLEDIMPWKAPGPPPKTWKHRYVFLLLAPANGTTDPLNLTMPGDRQHWGTGKERHGVRDWAIDNGLTPVGKSLLDVCWNDPTKSRRFD
ncbi:hypothetical protein SLS62_005228 [Diatrype stigma]|uniref:PEBP-like protein n=1 Tax=Diatrype stigma TaxID=117547 RepID=A0AAN9YPX6_9PEZI